MTSVVRFAHDLCQCMLFKTTAVAVLVVLDVAKNEFVHNSTIRIICISFWMMKYV